MKASLLYPARFKASIPQEDYIDVYYNTLGDRFYDDGIVYYTEDLDVLRRRAGLFRELTVNTALADGFRRFAATYLESVRSVEDNASFAEIYGTIRNRKAVFMLVRTLDADLKAQTVQSDAVKTLTDRLDRYMRSKDREALEEALGRLPDDFGQMKSIALGVNLDEHGRALEAGILTVNPYSYTASSKLNQFLMYGKTLHEAEPLFQNPLIDAGIVDRINSELMRAVDSVLRKNLKSLGIRLDSLLYGEDGMDIRLIDEVCFCADMTDYLTNFRPAGAAAQFADAERKEIPADRWTEINTALRPFGVLWVS